MTKSVSTSAKPKAGKAYIPVAIKRQMAAKTRALAASGLTLARTGDLWHDVMATTIDLPAIDQHGLAQGGVPTEVLDKVVASFVRLGEAEVLGAVGVSSRTVQRRKAGVLSTEHSGAVLDLIAVTQKAIEVLGSREAAEDWLHHPALAFDGRRPIELVSTRPGADLVKDHLTRMEYGVYA